jgi:hypothetical protein
MVLGSVSLPTNVVCTVQPQEGSVYGLRVPVTAPPSTRAKRIVSTSDDGGVVLDCGRSGALCMAAAARGTMTTSPKAVSLPALSLKMMLPLRPVASLLYSPFQLPTRLLRLAGSAESGIDAGFVAQAAASAIAAEIGRMQRVIRSPLKWGVDSFIEALDSVFGKFVATASGGVL